MNIDIFLISFFSYLLVPVVMIAKGKTTNKKNKEEQDANKETKQETEKATERKQ